MAAVVHNARAEQLRAVEAAARVEARLAAGGWVAVRTINGIRADDLLGDKLTSRQRIVIPVWMSAIGAGIRGLGRRVLWLATS